MLCGLIPWQLYTNRLARAALRGSGGRAPHHRITFPSFRRRSRRRTPQVSHLLVRVRVRVRVRVKGEGKGEGEGEG